jgi:hypothetical protein
MGGVCDDMFKVKDAQVLDRWNEDLETRLSLPIRITQNRKIPYILGAGLVQLTASTPSSFVKAGSIMQLEITVSNKSPKRVIVFVNSRLEVYVLIFSSVC